MIKADNNVALFDMDGTLADYDKQLKLDLTSIASPCEPSVEEIYDNMPDYIDRRRQVLTSQVGWWLKLERFQLGWDILEKVREFGYKIVILTKGPSSKHLAWAEKIQWCQTHLKDYIEGVTITHDKGLVYGKILVDDYPEYISRWLEWRPRGLVIMPAHPRNRDYRHPNVIRYDGSNLQEVSLALEKAARKN